jgi:hypothetical protein
MLVAILVLAQGVASRTVAELRSVRAAREAE